MSSVTSAASTSKASKLQSCVLCQQRKVKCDRLPAGCGNCTKARVKCVYLPLPPRRKRKKVGDSDLIVRLKKYEDLLQSLGVRIETPITQAKTSEATLKEGGVSLQAAGAAAEESSSSTPSDTKSSISYGIEYGKLVTSGGNTRYLGNPLWTSISDEVHDPNEILNEESDGGDDAAATSELTHPGPYSDPGEFLLGSQLSISLEELHPQPLQIIKLWQIFLDNVNPLTRVIHGPSTQKTLFSAAEDVRLASKSTEALLFSIYSCAVTSMEASECLEVLGDTKANLSTKYQFGAQRALINAGFLKTTDLTVLQAYVLYLISASDSYDTRSFWALTGVAERTGQQLGLHRDGSALGLSVFETEMRRRVWWQIIFIDSRAGELSGSGVSSYLWDTNPPLNVNDSQLEPLMVEPPLEHSGPTEGVFCHMRYSFGERLRTKAPVSAYHGAWNKLSTDGMPLEEKLREIDEFEAEMRPTLIDKCDNSVPIHFLTTSVFEAALCKMRFLASFRKVTGQTDEIPSQSEKDAHFDLALRTFEIGSSILKRQDVQRFMWHGRRQFQWQPFIYLLGQLRIRTSGEKIDAAWRYISEIFTFEPELIAKTNKALYIALSTLTVKAWDAYSSAQGLVSEEPAFISTLRKSDGVKLSSKRGESWQGMPRSVNQMHGIDTSQHSLPGDTMDVSSSLEDMSFSEPFDFASLDLESMSWGDWTTLLQDGT